jgi:primosomal protein N' (replication factor Y) (superfamily II helicase)
MSESLRSGDLWVEVLVDSPAAEKLYTYALPADISVQPGDILTVNFGAAQVGAIAIRCLDQPPPDLDSVKIRPILDRVSSGFFPPGYWELLQRVADYYHTSLMQAIRVALPPGLLQRSQRRIRLTVQNLSPEAIAELSLAAQQLLHLLQGNASGDYAWKYLQQKHKQAQRGLRELCQRGWVESYLQPVTTVKPKIQQAVTLLTLPDQELSPRQSQILELLQQRGGELWLQDLLQAAHTSVSTLRTLENKGYLAIASQQRLRLETGVNASSDLPQTLTAAQQKALDTIQSLQGYQQVLLHGVTGSGKTEVYLQAIAPILAKGKSALVLVPEIGLTPQLSDRCRARFGQNVCVYHSALSEGERYDTWRQLLAGDPQVIIGTRSAIFAPLPHLGLIILDEEHDAGFKQEHPAPSYHARTVAAWRAELTPCPLILGSATPSLESWSRRQEPGLAVAARKSDPHYLHLPERIHAQPLPPISVIDMRQELAAGNRSMFSRQLGTALEELAAQKQQGILFIPRRGHSTFVSCRSCGYVADCPNCSVSLTYHFTPATSHPRLRCHYCNYTRPHPNQCPDCQSPYFKYFGSGTQRVIEALGLEFPQLRLLRFDSDTTRTKGSHRQLLDRFAHAEADLMVGTQMLTKGIDLPQVTLVGVLSADSLLNFPDFRAGERTFQTLTQVAGRAGRGDQPGQVILQTYSPDHPVIQAVSQYEFEAFLATELEQRIALHYPPAGQLIVLRLSGLDGDRTEATAELLAELLRVRIHQSETLVELLGPAPANILRVAQHYRWQILLKLPPNPKTASFELPVAELRALCPSSIRFSIDVDPLTLL